MGKKSLPVYKIVINPDDKDETGINSIALVDRPAIQSNFITFNETKTHRLYLRPLRI